jgi:hypothetical protein
MFLSSRGEYHAEVTLPILWPLTSTGEEVRHRTIVVRPQPLAGELDSEERATRYVAQASAARHPGG